MNDVKGMRGAMLAASAALLLGLVAGCEREGPMERAGKQVDQGAEKVGQQVEQAGDAIKNKTDP